MYERLDPSRRLSKQFITGMSEFVSKAMDQTFYTLEGGIRCPCIKCVSEKILPPSHVRAHLLQYGFKPNYTLWVQHGEEMSSEDNVGYASSGHARMKPVDNIGSMTNMVYDAYMQEADITSHYGDMDNEDEYVEESPNAEALLPQPPPHPFILQCGRTMFLLLPPVLYQSCDPWLQQFNICLLRHSFPLGVPHYSPHLLPHQFISLVLHPFL